MSILTDEEIEELYFSELDNRELSFARAIEAAVLAKLAAQDLTPYAWDSESMGLTFENYYSDTKPLYTQAQLLAVQQRTAEACAKVCAKRSDTLREPACLGDATAIRNGEWREYL